MRIITKKKLKKMLFIEHEVGFNEGNDEGYTDGFSGGYTGGFSDAKQEFGTLEILTKNI
jgi:flagellar biosynthesis/type III secretory pathway protein FliH